MIDEEERLEWIEREGRGRIWSGDGERKEGKMNRKVKEKKKRAIKYTFTFSHSADALHIYSSVKNMSI